jgi:hypothetical protein
MDKDANHEAGQDKAFSTRQLVDADGAVDVEAPGCEQRLKGVLGIRPQRGLREIRARQPSASSVPSVRVRVGMFMIIPTTLSARKASAMTAHGDSQEGIIYCYLGFAPIGWGSEDRRRFLMFTRGTSGARRPPLAGGVL